MDDRRDKERGFFPSPRQPALFSSISTVKRDSIYLFIMGLIPILAASRRLRATRRGK